MSGGGPRRLVVGMTGASGAVLGIELLKALREFPDWETHLLVSEGARLTLEQETDWRLEQVAALADCCYRNDDLGARIASGTFRTQGMVIVPCSMKTLAGVAAGFSDSLLLRAADVVLKERRRLVLAARESPLSLIHLRNMIQATEAGAVVLPPVLAYYSRPASVQDMTRQAVGKILDLFGLEMPGYRRWGEPE